MASLINPTHTNLLINAIENSDAIVKGSIKLPEELNNCLENCDKPVLEYFTEEDFDSAYTNFYLEKVL